MKKYLCNLTSNEFSLSEVEKDYFLRNNIELPTYSEVERLRIIFSSIPRPNFSDTFLNNIGSNKYNYTGFDIHCEPFESGFNGAFDPMFDFKNSYSLFLEQFDFKKIKVVGDPLLYGSINIKNCLDCNFCIDCESCYECISCYDCDNVYFSRLANGCRNSYFLDNCYDCEDCLFCSNLTGSRYHIFNKAVSELEYFETFETLKLDQETRLYSERERFQNFLRQQPFYQIYSRSGIESGFPITEVESSVNFYVRECETCSSVFGGSGLRNCFGCGLIYGSFEESFSSGLIFGEGKNIKRSIDCTGKISDLDLCIACHDSHDLFACVGLNGQSFCIFNEQLTKKDYFKTLKEIKNILIDDGEASYFFPSLLKIIPYNNSLANNFFPLNKAQAELMGFSWDSLDDQVNIPTLQNDEKVCDIKGIAFKIPTRQIEFCEEKKIALPTRCPQQRFEDRLMGISISSMKKIKCSMSNKVIKVWTNEKREYLSEDYGYTAKN